MVDHLIELQMTTFAMKLLMVLRKSCKPGCLNTSFSPMMVGTVDKKIRKFTLLTKGIFFAFDFSM
jgi:hypothetical protein